MALKFESQTEFNGTAAFDGKVFINGTLWDNSGSQGSTGQVLTKDASNNVAWATPSGGGGTLDGGGTANKIAFWNDADTLDDTTLHWDSVNGRLGVNATSPSYPLDIQAETSMGGGTLHYDHANKRIGINTAAPTQKLDVAGAARFRNQFYDGNNSAGANGEVLKSTGTATDWVLPRTLGYRQDYAFSSSMKTGSSGTRYLRWCSEGDNNSLLFSSSLFAPQNGDFLGFTITADTSITGITCALYDNASQLYTSGTINLTANTPYHLSTTTAISQSDKLNVRFTHGTAGGNISFNVLARFYFDS